MYPLAFAAEQIAGDEYDVVNVTPPGAEPHDLELSARDVATLRDAAAVFLVAGLQPAVERAAADVQTKTTVIRDPSLHGWLSPRHFSNMVALIGAELDREDYVFDFGEKIIDLQNEYDAGLASCERRSFVTSHAAFGQLAADYDLEQIPIAGRSPEAEPAPQELERVVERVRESGATTIFTEPLVSPRLAETVARETGATVATLDPLESEPEEGDYFTVMRVNLAALREALGCR